MDNYLEYTLIGSGAFGEVYKAIRKQDLKTVAVKRILKTKEEKPGEISKEVRTLIELSQPVCNDFVVCYYDTFEDNKYVYIEMEYIEGINIEKYLRDVSLERGIRTADHYLLLILKDLAIGLTYIHSKGIIHSDLNRRNIVIDKDLTPKIVDFGLACTAKRDCLNYQTEVLDVYSLGQAIFWLAQDIEPKRYSDSGNFKNIMRLQSSNVLLNTVVNGMRDMNNKMTAAQVVKLLSNV